jgi:hypothetical protein
MQFVSNTVAVMNCTVYVECVGSQDPCFLLKLYLIAGDTHHL